MNKELQDYFNGICCGGVVGPTPCTAVVINTKASLQGNNVLIEWLANGAVNFDVIVDGNQVATAITTYSYLFANGRDGNNHNFTIVPHCATGTGVSGGGSFKFDIDVPQGCNAAITEHHIERHDQVVDLHFTASGPAVSFDIFLDGSFLGNYPASPVQILSAIDKLNHTYSITPHCAVGTGTAANGSFGFSNGCTADMVSMDAVQRGADVELTWQGNPAAVYYKIGLDGIEIDITFANSYILVGLADGLRHGYSVRAMCDYGGGNGRALYGEFQFFS